MCAVAAIVNPAAANPTPIKSIPIHNPHGTKSDKFVDAPNPFVNLINKE